MKPVDDVLAKKIVEANVKFYADTAKTYDAFHACTKSATQERYAQEIDIVLSGLKSGAGQPLVLDAATGTGSLAFQFARRGCRVIGVDVAAPMLELLRRKLGEFEPLIELVHSEVTSFLDARPAEFDVIAFGSALHHFPYYTQVVGTAAGRLKPGGALYIGLEPAALSSPRRHRWDRLLCRVDHLLAMLLREPGVFLNKVTARLRSRPATGGENVGALAEFHADTGVDKAAVIAELRRQGLTAITVRERYGGKYAILRLLKKWLVGEPDEFSLIAFKSPAGACT